VIEQIRYHDKEHWATTLHLIIGDSCCEVSFATAIMTFQDQPTLRLLSIGQRPFVRFAQVVLRLRREAMPLRDKRVKGHTCQEAQVAGTPQVLQAPLLHLSNLALAGNYTPRVRMARRHIETEVAESMADGADLGVSRISA
jgi:hypothetical protein